MLSPPHKAGQAVTKRQLKGVHLMCCDTSHEY